ncbi:MAG: pseudouridine synthase, partial [Selenomonadaceae bacterium]|nr:pseudouridine synthase [Selenomonadaceae bacterium]
MNKNYETSFIPAAMAGITLEEYLKRELKLSARSRQRLFHGHGILVNGKSAYSKRILKADDRVSVRQQGDSTYGLEPENGPVEVLYEDSAIIILSKPAGMMVHPAGQTASGTLSNYLAGYFSQKGQIIRIRPLHRLDRDTSGCVLFAKSAAVQQALEKQL